MHIKKIYRQDSTETPAQLIESLVEKAVDYGKTSIQLAKLRALSKASNLVSSYVAHSVVLVFIFIFLLFLNLGLAIWIGDILGKSYYGFLVISLAYGVGGIIIHFFMHNWLKRVASDHFINRVLK